MQLHAAPPCSSGICRKRVPSSRKPRRRPCTGSGTRPRRLHARAAEVARAQRVLDLARERRSGADQASPRGRACAAASGRSADSGCSRGSPCRRPPRRSGSQAARTVATACSSNCSPAWMIEASVGQGTACSVTCGSTATTASLVGAAGDRRRGRQQADAPAARGGDRPQRLRAARRRARRCPASSPSCAR